LERSIQLIPPGWLIGGIQGLVHQEIPWDKCLLLFAAGYLGYRLGFRSLCRSLENPGRGGRPDFRRDKAKVQMKLWSLPLLGESFSALFEKEMKYLLRSNQGRFAFVWPIVFVIMFRFLPTRGTSSEMMNEWTRPYSLLFAASFFFLFFIPFYVNLFAFDHRGTRLYFLAPLSMRQVLMAKNLAVVSLGVLCFLWLSLWMRIAFGPISIAQFLSGLGALAIGLPLLLSGGNFISCYFPKPLRMTDIRGNNPPHISVFLGMILLGLCGVLLAITGLIQAVVGVAGALTFELVMLGFVGALYFLTLTPAARLYEQRREEFLRDAAGADVKE